MAKSRGPVYMSPPLWIIADNIWRGCRGGAIKAHRVCQLVFPGEHECSPSEQVIPNLWMGGLVAHPLGWG